MKARADKNNSRNIHFSTGQTTLGTVLVAKSDKGICAIMLGDDLDRLLQELQDDFSQAILIKGNEDFKSCVAQIVDFIEAPHMDFNLPLDVQATPFQERVWQILRQIPPGQTISYSALAQRIGQPKAVRAVAQACGANKIAVIIPCHRVIRNNGAISGYRWGIERKCALLEKEAQIVKGQDLPEIG